MTGPLQDALARKGVDLFCAGSLQDYINDPVAPGTFLMAAIDPTEEKQLVHLDKSLSSGRMLTAQDHIHLDINPNLASLSTCQPGQQNTSSSCYVPNNDIPVLFQTQLPGQSTIKSNFTKLAPGTLSPQTVLANGGATYLNKLPHQQSIFQSVVPQVQSNPQHFSGSFLRWDGHSWQPFDLQYGILPNNASLKFLYTPSALTYRQKASPDGQTSNAYELVPTGVQEPEVAFRALHPLNIAKRAKPLKPFNAPKTYYFLDPVGQFKGDTLAAQFSNPLNWLPENTYTFPPTVLRYDAQGNPVTPTNLLPTTNTAGYLLQPPLALTTLDAAVRLRGDHISAIRIRVTDVDAANPASWKRIQQVAGLIQQRTHLQVLVTLGSSPRPTLVYIPGVSKEQFGAAQNIAPVGWVEERWIAIGVSILYLAQLGATRLLLLGAVLAVCLGYLVVAFSALVSAQRREFAILNVLGWRPWQPIRLFLAQALILAIGGGIVGVGLALLISSLLEITPIWLIVLWTIPVMLAFALISVLVSLWVLAAQHSVQNIVPLPLLACGAILLMLLVSALAILPALHAINRMQVVQALRSE